MGRMFVMARNDKYTSGRRIIHEGTLLDPRDAEITGKEFKDELDLTALPGLETGFVVFGLVCALIVGILSMIGATGDHSVKNLIITFIPPLCIIAAGIYFLIRNHKTLIKLQSVSSINELEPYIEKALTKKVSSEERNAFKKEKGEQAAYNATFFCSPARLAASGDFDTPKKYMYQEFPFPVEFKQALTQIANGLPEENRILTRRQ